MATGVASLCNPYGLGIVEAAWRPLTTVANRFIDEWQPLSLSPRNLITYFPVVLFVALVPRRPLPSITNAERYLAYLWLLFGLSSIRHVPIFAIMAAPLLACSLEQLLGRLSSTRLVTTAREALVLAYDRRPAAIAAGSLAIALSLWLPTASAARFYGQEHLAPPQLPEEIQFIRLHYDKVRFFNSFDIGATLIYESQGTIPVFVDARTETAYPRQVLSDYWEAMEGRPGWDGLFARYGIKGAVVANSDGRLQGRFSQLNGWKQVFRGPQATIYFHQ